MREITIQAYTFDELSDAAKETARNWFRETMPAAWCDESAASIVNFCEAFGVRMVNYEVDTGSYYYKTDADNSNFRGIDYLLAEKMGLSDGYIIGEIMREVFLQNFKEHGALYAFNEALDAGFRSWRDDLAYQDSDESIDEVISINEYEFDHAGNRI